MTTVLKSEKQPTTGPKMEETTEYSPKGERSDYCPKDKRNNCLLLKRCEKYPTTALKMDKKQLTTAHNTGEISNYCPKDGRYK